MTKKGTKKQDNNKELKKEIKKISNKLNSIDEKLSKSKQEDKVETNSNEIVVLREEKMVEIELDKYLEKIRIDTEKGLGENWYLVDGIEVELTVVKQKIAGGGIKIFVADVEGKYSKEQLQKIKMKIQKKKKKTFVIGG